MSKTYQKKPAGRSRPAAAEVPAPAEATIALGEIMGSAREGLLAFAVGTGLQVMQVMQVLMEESVSAVCGPRDKHNPDRVGYRHGAEAGSVTLGGRRVPVEPSTGAGRRRVRGAAGAGV